MVFISRRLRVTLRTRLMIIEFSLKGTKRKLMMLMDKPIPTVLPKSPKI